MLELLLAPLVACVVLAGIHCYLGLHVLMRGVVFVDLALAQIAALGVAVGAVAGALPHTASSYLWSAGFSTLGAALFAWWRFDHRRVPQEAVIGIIYAVSAAVTVLILSHSAIDKEEIDHMLLGRLLFVDWPEIGAAALVYAAVAGIHALCRRPFFAISRGETVRRTALWDFVFYATFGIVVSSSVQLAGVLAVFSFLIVPAACAALFCDTTTTRLFVAWGFALLASATGLCASAWLDWPVGAAVVTAFGAVFAVCALAARRYPQFPHC